MKNPTDKNSSIDEPSGQGDYAIIPRVVRRKSRKPTEEYWKPCHAGLPNFARGLAGRHFEVTSPSFRSDQFRV
jgi:hypothetical protein